LQRRRTNFRPGSRRNNEQGIVILLVAVVMLFVVGAMAALSIDVVTLYTARSEAQLAADSAALTAARVLANSGETSDPNAASDGLMTNAQSVATVVATQVAQQNEVGGRNLVAAEVSVNYAGPTTNPTVTVRVQRTDLPTFFARIWGSKEIAVAASATAEAYNPSGANALSGKTIPVATACVKPWLLPNIDPSNPPNPIFVTATGAIAPTATALLGWTYNTPTPNKPMSLACGPPTRASGDCSTPPSLPTPAAWSYYPGDDATTFPHPTRSLPSCTPALTTNYQESIAGCIVGPISCNSTANIDTSNYSTRNTETADAVNCLTHATTTPGDGDQVDLTAAAAPSPPFQFLAGAGNPVSGSAGKDVLVSSSLVTVPVFDVGTFNSSTGNVQIVGFVQLFLNPDSIAAPDSGPNSGNVNATVINMAGCGTSASGQPILGNGASPVAVRLISP
jgi:Flp pilus assembly protein TadG